jgi:serine phosphatase RsbU (regulator of sigma subunit)
MKKKVYVESFLDNEADANKQMIYVNAAAAVFALVLWVLYILRIFSVPDYFLPMVLVMFPLAAVILLIPLFFIKTDKIRKPAFKYFILFSLLAVMMAVNITVPKHGILLWPIAILMANHYYNPRIGRIMYFSTIVAMLVCMYLGMFFGEYDQNLLGGGIVENGKVVTVDGFEERYEMLRTLYLRGNNRYFKSFIYYYLPRAAIVSMLFMISNLLNKRTYSLFSKSLKDHDAQEKVKTELGVAKDIQVSTLPSENLFSDSLQIIGELKEARAVGGDLYDYVELDDDHVAVIIGDVSDKGVPAAMFMMKTITSFRDFASADKTPSQILKEINTSISKGNTACMFVTCFLAIIDKRNGKVIYSNAGHNPPIIGSNQNHKKLNCKPGILLGCFPNAVLRDEELVMNPGDTMTLYTDGVTEARNENGDFFGEERFIQTMDQQDYTSIEDLHNAINGAISDFVKETPQSDDITFLTVKYLGNNN